MMIEVIILVFMSVPLKLKRKKKCILLAGMDVINIVFI